MTDLPGLDLARFTAWFDGACPGEIGGPLHGRLIAGGRSNLTYEVSDGTRNWVVRRPPLGHVLATAHDMEREYRVITALRDTSVPVPLTYALCADPGVLGAPFYVMSKVDGIPYRTADQLAVARPDPGPGHRGAAGRHARAAARGGPRRGGARRLRQAGGLPRPAGAPVEEAA